MTTIAAPRPIEATPENPRAVIGGNRPPIEEQGVADFNDAIDGHQGLRQRIADLVDSASRAVATDDETAGRCAELIRQMGAAEKVVDAEREQVKRPYLQAGRNIDDAAKTLVAKLTPAKATVRGIAEAYMRDKVAREEAARRERERIEREARERLEAEARERAEAERRRLQAEEDARAAAEARDAAVVEVKPDPVEIAPMAPAPAAATQVRSDFGAVASARKVKVAVVTDWPKAFKAVRTVPAVQEAIQKAINGLVRAGQTNIPGVEIRDEVGLSVR